MSAEPLMNKLLLHAILLVAVAPTPGRADRKPPAPTSSRARRAAVYYPERFGWQHRKPEEVGMDPALVAEAAQQAIAGESPASRDPGPWRPPPSVRRCGRPSRVRARQVAPRRSPRRPSSAGSRSTPSSGRWPTAA